MAFKINWNTLVPGYDSNRHYPDVGEVVRFDTGMVAIPFVYKDNWRCPSMIVIAGDFKGSIIKVPIENQPYIPKDATAGLRDYSEFVCDDRKLKHYPGDIFHDAKGDLLLYVSDESYGSRGLVLEQNKSYTYDYRKSLVCFKDEYLNYL